MKAPREIKDQFDGGTPTGVWFKADLQRGGMPGYARGWVETAETDYLVFEALRGDKLYVPFDLVFLCELLPSKLTEIKTQLAFDEKLQQHNRKVQEAQMEAQEEAIRHQGSNLATPVGGGPMPPFQGPR